MANEENLTNEGEDTRIEATLIQRVLDLHPSRVTNDELVRDLAGEDADFGASDFEDDEDEDFDELSIEELFLNVTAMWSVLGAIDSDDRLTPLGWWGLPEAMSRAWTEPEAD